MNKKLLCSTCENHEIPEYDENIKGKYILKGFCYKCGNAVYEFIPNKNS